MAFKIAELFVDISVKGVTNLNKKIDKTRKNVAKLGQSFQALGSKITGIGTQFLKVGAIIGAPLVLGIRQFAKLGDEIQKMSKRTGVAVKELSRLAFATSQSGASLQVLEVAIKTMQRGLVDASRGLTTATDNFDDLGIALEDIQSKSPEEQFILIAEKLSQIEDPSLRAGLALKVFGRSGAELLPLLENGAKGIREMGDEAERLGLTFDQKAADKAAVLTDALDKLARVVNAVFFAIGAALSESVTDLADRITSTITSVIKWIKENETLIKIIGGVALAVTLLGGALVVLGIAVKAIGVALLFLSANPIGAVITVVALVVLAILSWIGVFSDLNDKQEETQKEMKKTVSEMKKQKAEIDKLRESAKKPIVIKTEFEKPVAADVDTTPFFLREGGELPAVGLEVKFKNVDKEVAKIQKEISFQPVFGGIEDLFRNAQEAFAGKKAEQINEDIVKTNKMNTEATKKNTVALDAFGRKLGVFGTSGLAAMKPLGS